MKIALVDVDGHHFPNLALMRLSAWHKARGDDVEWWNGFAHYERAYLSKVFTFTPDFDTVIDADEIITGGTGYQDDSSLPPEVESTPPDYSIYPWYDRAIGFLTRGCIRDCPWCVVPRKEGGIRPAATWEEVKRPDSREIIFLDNNVMASGHGLEQIRRMGRERVWVDFNQGLDARLITPETAALLAGLRWIRFIRLSCDTSTMLPVVERAAAYLRKAGVAAYRLWAYVLVQDIPDAHRRVLALEEMGITPFAQPYRDYDGGEPSGNHPASRKPSPAGSTSVPSTTHVPGKITIRGGSEMASKRKKQTMAEDSRYHDTWRLLKKYRDVVWSMELSVQQVKKEFEIEFGSTIDDFLESVYLAGANLGGTKIEDHARCIERSNRMLTLLNNAVELLRTRHKSGETYYWLLYYTFLSPQQMGNVNEIIGQLRPHIRDISRATYYRKREQAVEALSSILWGYTSRDCMALLTELFSDLDE